MFGCLQKDAIFSSIPWLSTLFQIFLFIEGLYKTTVTMDRSIILPVRFESFPSPSTSRFSFEVNFQLHLLYPSLSSLSLCKRLCGCGWVCACARVGVSVCACACVCVWERLVTFLGSPLLHSPNGMGIVTVSPNRRHDRKQYLQT